MRKSLKELPQRFGNREIARSRESAAKRSISPSRRPFAMAVAIRRQTPEEERQLEAVLDLFLMQIVHEQFERQKTS